MHYKLLIFLCFVNLLFTQKRWAAEIFVNVLTDFETLEFSAPLVSSIVWDDEFYISENLYGFPVTTIGVDDTGWDFVGIAPYVGNGTLGYGLYKINNISHDRYFFLDLRSDNFVPMSNFDSYFNYYGGFIRNFEWGFGTSDQGRIINNGETLTIWDIKPQLNNQSTSKFQPTTPTNLMIGDTDIHPLLTWNFSEPDAAQYEVWRKDEVNKFSIWYKIAENLTSTTFTDTEVYLDEVGILFSYKIIAVSGDGSKYSPDYSNVESVVG